jgi:ComF family protein
MSILETSIGLLAPPQCINCGEEGCALCAQCAEQKVQPFGERCWRCNKLSPNSKTCASCTHTGAPAHVWIVSDHDGLTRDLLSLYKFGHQRAAAEPIAKLMADTFLRSNDLTANYITVPIPTATSRIRERGFGHTELLAKKVSHQLKAEYANCLRRLDQTRQLGSVREVRLKQLSSSFAIKSPGRIRGQNILLIDDVVTTGGTICAATKTLRAAGATRIDALLFAKRL